MKSKFKILILSGAIFILSGLCYWITHARPNMLEHATSVVTFPKEKMPPMMTFYRWKSEHLVYIYEHHVPGHAKTPLTITQYDTDTKQQTTLQRYDTPNRKSAIYYLDKDDELELYKMSTVDDVGELSTPHTSFLRSFKGFSLRLPADFQLCDYAVSPDGKRAAWLLFVTSTPFWEMWRHRLQATYVPVPKYHIELWTTSKDTSQVRHHGWEKCEDPNARIQMFAFTHRLAWTPDGKNVSLFHKDALWKIPID